MCGIAGLIQRGQTQGSSLLRDDIARMTDSVRHRGPDGGDVWIDEAACIALGQRRLAIIDLSPLGAQPMHSACGRYVVTYNGEIFNYQDLRAELVAAGVRFRGDSDTEVILEGFVRWGVRATIERTIGMFAIGLWDRQMRELWLVRDRLGVKPLYYARHGGRLAFGSELKAIRAAGGFPVEVDRDALAAYLRHGYVPGPRTIYAGIRQLRQGTILRLDADGNETHETYWDAREKAIAGRAHWNAKLDEAEAIERLDALLRDAVKRRMVADVPLGAFLSGGIDSSTVVAMMQAQSTRPVKTFTIGFDAEGYDEAAHAKAVAAHLGTDHTELYVTPEHALGVVPKLADSYDEPFADSSQIPTFLVSEMTRRHVTVALSGDGGDENFAGYNRYVWAETLWRNLRRVPKPLRIAAARLAAASAPLAGFVPHGLGPVRPAEKMAKIAEILALDSPGDIYRRLISQWPDPAALVVGGVEPRGAVWDDSLERDMPEFVARMQLLDTVTYLPDDILTKVDRATMAVALEGRMPLLDHRVVEHAWTLPPHLKLRGGEGKWILRRVLERYVPRALFERPKMGFGVPIDSWLRGPLRDWAEDLLDPRAIAAEGFLRPEPIRLMWQEHLSGVKNRQYQLWTILIFRAWVRRWL